MVKTGERVGLFGGTFDPVHVGHLILAADVLEKFELDRLIWIPAGQTPLRTKATAAAGEHRLAMVRRALSGMPGMEASGVELERGGLSYTVDTVGWWRAKVPGAAFFWILGRDQFATLGGWHRAGDLAREVEFIVLERPGEEIIEPWWPDGTLRWQPCAGRRLDLSSTEIRRRLAEGLPVKPFLPAGVENYILEHQLYQRLEEPSITAPATYGS